jgi:hypothetical protein
MVLGATAVAAAAFAVGCASAPVRLAQPVGPAPRSIASGETGKLVVYTEAHSNKVTPDGPGQREPFTLFDARGKEIDEIASPDDAPAELQLPPGDYVVRASAFGKSEVDVPVRVASGRATEVHLDGSKPNFDATNQTAVYAPDGSFVGWRDRQSTASR